MNAYCAWYYLHVMTSKFLSPIWTSSLKSRFLFHNLFNLNVQWTCQKLSSWVPHQHRKLLPSCPFPSQLMSTLSFKCSGKNLESHSCLCHLSFTPQTQFITNFSGSKWNMKPWMRFLYKKRTLEKKTYKLWMKHGV